MLCNSKRAKRLREIRQWRHYRDLINKAKYRREAEYLLIEFEHFRDVEIQSNAFKTWVTIELIDSDEIIVSHFFFLDAIKYAMNTAYKHYLKNYFPLP